MHKPGDIIAQRYRLIAPLGQGAFGITYEAEDLVTYQRVAIKSLSLRQITEWKALEMFEREAKVLSYLSHPGIPQYLNFFHVDSPSDRRFYLVRKVIDGNSLGDLVCRGWRPSERQVKQIAIEVLKILKYLQSRNPPVIHRDIKPQNILRGRNGRIFLLDFGAVQDIYRNALSQGGTLVGTVGYMPPEQFRGQVYFSSDLYGLGATLLFLLTGRSPDELPQKRLKIHFRSRVAISDAFADWLEKTIEPAAEDRYQTAAEALKALGSSRRQRQRISRQGRLKRSPLNSARSIHHKPAGSSISCQKTSTNLVVDIPYSFHGLKIFLLLFIGIPAFIYLILVPAGLNGLSAWLSAAIGISLFSAFVALLKPFHIHLEIDSHSFSLQGRNLFEGCILNYSGRTADLIGAEIGVNRGYKGRKTTCCRLWEGVQCHTFGDNLSIVEQEWLVEEISKFIRFIQSR